MILLGCTALLSACKEKPRQQTAEEFYRESWKNATEFTIRELQRSQHVAVCVPVEGKGHVIERVLKGEAGVDFVGSLKVGEPWAGERFPKERLLVYQQVNLDDDGKGSRVASATGFFSFDDKGRVVISKDHAYLDLEEVAKLLKEDAKADENQ